MSTDHQNPYLPPSAEIDVVDPHQLYDGKLLMTARGLRIMYAGFVVTVVGLVGVIPVSIFGVAFGALFIGFVPLLGSFLVFVGPFLCLTVPSESGLRPSIMLAVFLQLMAFLLIIFLGVFDEYVPNFLIGTLGFILPMAAMAAFLHFLSRLTACMSRPDLSRRVRRVFILGGVTLLAPLPMFAAELFSLGGNMNLFFGLAYSIILLLLFLLLFVAFANLVNAISRGIRRPSEAVANAVF